MYVPKKGSGNTGVNQMASSINSVINGEDNRNKAYEEQVRRVEQQ